MTEEQDCAEGSTATKQVEVHQPYTGRFVWPAGDYARWPGSGDFAFDSIRRYRLEKDQPRSTYGQMLKRVWRSSEHLRVLDPIRAPLKRFFDDEAVIETLALFYYRRRTRWTRLDKLGGASEVEVRDLVAMGGAKEFVAGETSHATKRLCYALLTVEELRFALNCGPFLKDKLVNKAVEAHETVFPELMKITQGGVFALDPEIHQSLLRLHQITFSACNFEPEDAAEFLNSGVLGMVPFLNEDRARNDMDSCPGNRRDCYGDLIRTLDEMASMANAMWAQQSVPVAHGLHVASTILLDQKTTTDGHCCRCWMAARAEENALRMINLGVSVLEKDRRYEEALHYLRMTLQALEQRCILDIEDPDPDTRISFHRARLLNRYCVDLGHLDRRNEALEELERVLAEPNGILWDAQSTRKIHTMNRIGGQGMGLILLFLRLSEPPRRWRPKIPLSVIDLPEERICVKRLDGKRVENLALDYFLSLPDKRWTHGQHCENGIVHTLFGLLFLTENRNRRVCFDDFVITSDRNAIARLLHRIESGHAPEIVKENWTKYRGSQIRGVNWERNSLEETELIARNMGGKVLAMICRLFLDAYQAWCGGIADLLLWNDREVKFVEIKGPGDSLSDRQRAWGEKLVSCGANACVCYVTWQQADKDSGTVSTMVFAEGVARQDSMFSERRRGSTPSDDAIVLVDDDDEDDL